MAVYEASVQTTAAAAGAAFLAFQNTAAALGVRAQIFEIGVATNAATLSALGLVRASVNGTASGTPPVGHPLDPAETQFHTFGIVRLTRAQLVAALPDVPDKNISFYLSKWQVPGIVEKMAAAE